ncbi:flavohemoglobin expression-modulating QEGLA motif protein [Lysobacter brunescens]|uniref:Flavohemoglobin expression-modulating QEGLA motif protein n=1 Tax=Lysobacter brunescens TaxID=262323 RepID=A0ABW2Y9H4_9GAMM
MSVPRDIARHAVLDARLAAAVRGIRLLETLSWPASAQETFLGAWKIGRIHLPKIDYPKDDYTHIRAELDAVTKAADPDHPLGHYLIQTADSWRIATRLLDAAGGYRVTAYSTRLYGRPVELLPGDGPTNLEAAQHFVTLADDMDQELRVIEPDAVIAAETVRDELQAAVDGFFTDHKVKVELDPALIAKAAASPTRIRVRTNTGFSEYDRHQLLVHEAFVHTLTGINGREQPHLKSMARSAPRTTATQEGLATFAELISGSMDIERMKRISLRIVAIDMAIGGADFVQVFRFFLDAGQSPEDSFASAQRVFRGAPLGGGAAFTKDTVYLHGLLSVHTFFRWCLRHRKLSVARQLFAGKLALEDVFALQPMFDSGAIAQPHYLPPWMQRANGLAGMLAFSLFANKIRLDRVEADDLVLGLGV